jgi:hypothetical protein
MFRHPARSVIEWPDSVRVIGRRLFRGVREIWRGLDTLSAIRHGTVPLSGHAQEQLAVRGDVDALMARARAGDEYATELLVRMLNDSLGAR